VRAFRRARGRSRRVGEPSAVRADRFRVAGARVGHFYTLHTLVFFFWFFDAVRGSMRPRRDAGRVWIVYFDVLVEKVRADDDKHLSVPSDCLR